MKNSVAYNVPEGTSTMKADNVIRDSQVMTTLYEHTTDGIYQPDVLQVRRLGSKVANVTETQETGNHPLFVTFPGEKREALGLKNLYGL